jgi:hypothetical protein
MCKSFLISFLLVGLLTSVNFNAAARNQPATFPEPESGSVVCPPGLYTGVPSDCLALGPSGFLAQSASEGINFPINPLPAYSPDRSLSDLPYQYFKVTSQGASLYSSPDAIAAHQPSKNLDPSNHLYVSYKGNSILVGKDYYYFLRSGYYVFAEGGRLGKYDPPFQGLVFSSTPQQAFGWILGETQSHPSPGLDSPESGISYYRFKVVKIFGTQEVDNLTWDLIGPGEWIDARQIARVDPVTAPPAGVTGNRWISVNLFEQTASVYDNNHLVFATMVSTGVDRFWTRPGLFHIQKKLETETMSNSVKGDFYYLEDVPWTMYFDEARALHGAYWHNNFGQQQSHGCVNLSVGDARWLYDWAAVGDFVYVYDPSGQTPTDPALFGNGAP